MWLADDVFEAGKFLMRKVSDGPFLEKISILADGSLKLPTKEGDPMVSLFVHLASESADSLMQFAQLVQQSFGDLRFTFESDPEGQWIQYKVSRAR